MKGLVGASGVIVLGIYLASLTQHAGEVVATEQLLWFVGAAILGLSAGLLIFDP